MRRRPLHPPPSDGTNGPRAREKKPCSVHSVPGVLMGLPPPTHHRVLRSSGRKRLRAAAEAQHRTQRRQHVREVGVVRPFGELMRQHQSLRRLCFFSLGTFTGLCPAPGGGLTGPVHWAPYRQGAGRTQGSIGHFLRPPPNDDKHLCLSSSPETDDGREGQENQPCVDLLKV